MNYKGWVKLHRKALDNEIFVHDPTAWRIFEYFLLSVDRETGSMRYGRIWLSKLLDINESTVYKAIKRLEKAKMVTQVSNNRYSTVLVLNWHRYQGDGNTPQEQRSNNEVTHYKKREVRKVVETPPRVVAVLKELGDKDFTPTKRTIALIEEDFGSYIISPSIKKLADHNELNGRKVTTLGIRNWLQNDKDWGKLERRDR